MSATKKRKKKRKQIEKRKTKLGIRQIVVDGWAGFKMRVFTLSNLIIMDGQMDGQTDGWTDGRTDGRMDGQTDPPMVMRS